MVFSLWTSFSKLEVKLGRAGTYLLDFWLNRGESGSAYFSYKNLAYDVL